MKLDSLISNMRCVVTWSKEYRPLDMYFTWFACVQSVTATLQLEQRYSYINITVTVTTQNPPRGTFLEKFSTVGDLYFHLFKWGKITTWQEV